MIERLEVILSLIAVVGITVAAIRYWVARRQMATITGGPNWQALGIQPDGRATLVAFSTPSCAACHRAQEPAIGRAQQQLAPEAVRLVHVDASRQPEVANAFGIMTVPSTVVIGSAGRIVAINQGFAPSTRLVEQLQHA